MRDVAVVGVGMTKFGQFEDSSVELFSQAAMDAILESNLEPKNIQALFVGNCYSDLVESQASIAAHCASDLGMAGIPANRAMTGPAPRLRSLSARLSCGWLQGLTISSWPGARKGQPRWRRLSLPAFSSSPPIAVMRFLPGLLSPASSP